MIELHHRKIRSFVRRPGRTTAAQQRALERLWPRYGLPSNDKVIDLAAAFGRIAPVILEIGFGDGEALFTSAASNPDIDHVGVEIHEPGIGHLLMLLERADSSNVRVIARDAVEVLDSQLGPESIDAVRLFFPDPWPKKRHHKRRLVQSTFVRQLARVLKRGGLLHIATDWAHYATQIADTLSTSDVFSALSPEQVRAEPFSARPPTKFERRGRGLGHEVQDLFYKKT